MTTSATSFETQSKTQKIPSWLIWAFVVVSFLGFLDATYLTVVHFAGLNIGCIITTGCDTVTTSVYSEIFGIPMALFGAIFYLTIFIASLMYVDKKNPAILFTLPILGLCGFITSLYLIYLQLFVIKALCFYCLLSAGTSTLLFVLGVILFVKNPNKIPGRQ